ncbi:hypothetical protein [Vibrio caribbeanicus]|uniref:Stress-response A/B barrel domain-containing protein n=1 Tax=Vibrio caribbeanicus ATCC BAA-2122 TaxID=796620 RepID=E3BGM5_9VIBR|nr:hypothetical protein [Vibrio caribbeanicus]EFP97833.1 hypothetical protein VIBC2010_01019 [Vibrio caribbeanicus ATCC BAA-2122]
MKFISFPKKMESFLASHEKRKHAPTVIAFTKMKIKFNSLSSLNDCFDELMNSDERLLSIPNDKARYDWHRVDVIDNEIRFGVVWYDEVFFDEKREIYTDPMHSKMLNRFGVAPSDYEVNHYRMVR